MTPFQLLESRVGALALRMDRMEASVSEIASRGTESQEAGKLADSLGFDRSVMMRLSMVGQRRRLAWELRKQGWSAARIARALNTGERSVVRLLAKAGFGNE